jgi:hypothetical protein
MKLLSFINISILILLLTILIPQPIMAYVGPGTGITAIGAFFAIVASIIAALFGFIWYPIKRLLRNRKLSKSNKTKEGEEQ